jgi:hypothetical protein
LESKVAGLYANNGGNPESHTSLTA